MTTITMLDLRNHAKEIVTRAQRGERMVLTYRGKPTVVIEPYREVSPKPVESDPLFDLFGSIHEDAALTNEEMDAIIYDNNIH